MQGPKRPRGENAPHLPRIENWSLAGHLIRRLVVMHDHLQSSKPEPRLLVGELTRDCADGADLR